MTDTQWTDEPMPKKKGMPAWLMFCGAGCLLLVLVLVVAMFFMARKFKDVANPDVQWPKVQAILPFEERPDYGLVMGIGIMGYEMYVLEAAPLVGTVMRFSRAQRKEVQQLMDPNMKGGLFGLGARENLEAGVMTIQGAERQVLHFFQGSGGQGGHTGQSVIVDLSSDAEANPVFVQLTRMGGGADGGQVTPEEVEDFFAPFQLR